MLNGCTPGVSSSIPDYIYGQIPPNTLLILVLVLGDNEAVGRSAMRWSCLQFNVLLLRNLTDVCPLKQGGSRYPPSPTRRGRILENNIARYSGVPSSAGMCQTIEPAL